MPYDNDMDTETKQALDAFSTKLDAVYASTEKTRRYFMWTMYITIALFVLPLIGLLFVVPSFMANYVGQMQNLGL